MPVMQYALSGVARGLRAYLNLEAGIVRDGGTSGHQAQQPAGAEKDGRSQEIERLRRLVTTKERELVGLRAKMDDTNGGGVRPESLVWIFGDGRTGSTWLMRMVEELEGQTLWREPMVGLLFGYLYYLWSDEKYRATKHFIFGRNKQSWLRSIRNFVLDEAGSRFPSLERGDYLVIKEPNGSIGAPLLMEALPESRMILLVRDPRDVVASALDAHKKGGWVYDRINTDGTSADDDPDEFVESRAHKYLWYVGNSKLAYDAHDGPKALVRYEDLRADTLGEVRRIYSELGIPVDDAELVGSVEKHSWEKVPEEEKGEGKFHRKATPGGWREDLTPEQAETIERITAPLLEEFYYREGNGESLSERLAQSRQRMRMLYGS